MTWNGTRLLSNSQLGGEYPSVIILYLTWRQRRFTEISNPAQPWKWTFILLQNSARLTVSHLNKKLWSFCFFFRLVLHTANKIIWTCPSTAERPTTALASVSRAQPQQLRTLQAHHWAGWRVCRSSCCSPHWGFVSTSTKRADVYREKRRTPWIDSHHAQSGSTTHQLPQRHFRLWE